MSITVSGVPGGTYAEKVAGEVRAMMARRGLNQSAVAEALGTTQMYVSRRVKLTRPTPMDVADLERFARVLRCEIGDLLPRLDSNQEPSGYLSSLVSDEPWWPDAA